MSYRWYILKRKAEDLFIFPFILIGRWIALLKPAGKAYRVYYFFPFCHIGGAEKVHAQVAQATGGADCIIYFTKRSHNDLFLEEFKKSNCVIKDISYFTDNKFLYFFNLIYRGILSGYINRQQTKAVIFNGQCNFGYKISPWIRKDIPQVELIHSLNSFSYIRIPFLPFISKTIMISRKRIEDHKKLYAQKSIPGSLTGKIEYIPNAIPLPAGETSKPTGSFTVLYVGRGTEEKRIQLVTKIAAQLQAMDTGVGFEFLGDVSEAIDPAKFPYITFHGNQSETGFIDSVYDNAHVLLLTSSTEGFPMVVIEAMAHGCAVIATPVGDLPFHVQTGKNGFLFSSVEDENRIVEEGIKFILQLKNDRILFKLISDANFQYAKHNFGIEQFNAAYRQLLKQE